jgi:hypothetical protein
MPGPLFSLAQVREIVAPFRGNTLPPSTRQLSEEGIADQAELVRVLDPKLDFVWAMLFVKSIISCLCQRIPRR